LREESIGKPQDAAAQPSLARAESHADMGSIARRRPACRRRNL